MSASTIRCPLPHTERLGRLRFGHCLPMSEVPPRSPGSRRRSPRAGDEYGQMMGSTQYTFEGVDQMPDFWALSDQQLARSCVRIAQGWVPGLRPFLRAEALRLFLLWKESLHAPGHTRDKSEHQAGELAALRKRTIQILVSISVPRPAQIPVVSVRP